MMDMAVIAYRLSKDRASLILIISIATMGVATVRANGATPLPDELRLVPQSIILNISRVPAENPPPAAARVFAVENLALLETAAASNSDPASASSMADPSEDACQAPSDHLDASPMILRKPPPGARADITIRANRLMTLDFSPFDAQLLPHDHDLTLIFDDESVIVLHRVTQAGKPLAAAFRLPDGSIISLCDLLAVVPQSPTVGTTGKIPQLKIPQDTKIPAE
jgi:hypothetical protein